MTNEELEKEVACLNRILVFAESDENFCIAHELVDRNRITRKSKKILKAILKPELDPFRFLINKN